MEALSLVSGLLEAGLTTLVLATGSWMLATILGFLMGSARFLGGRPAAWLLVPVLAVGRATPPLVVLYFVYFGLPQVGIDLGSIRSAIVALGIAESVFIAEYTRAALATVAGTQREAGESLGLSSGRIFLSIEVPQAIVVATPALINAYVSLLKVATLASAVGAAEILYEGEHEMQRTGNIALVAAVVIGVYVVVTFPALRLTRRLERRIAKQSYSGVGVSS